MTGPSLAGEHGALLQSAASRYDDAGVVFENWEIWKRLCVCSVTLITVMRICLSLFNTATLQEIEDGKRVTTT